MSASLVGYEFPKMTRRQIRSMVELQNAQAEILKTWIPQVGDRVRINEFTRTTYTNPGLLWWPTIRSRIEARGVITELSSDYPLSAVKLALIWADIEWDVLPLGFEPMNKSYPIIELEKVDSDVK